MKSDSFQNTNLEGIVVLDKPTGMTSHDVVDKVRRKFNIRKVGHAGTLDPLATGVLVMLVGKATKLSNKFMEFDKAYNATIILGTKTTTADVEGDVVKKMPYDEITKAQVEQVLKEFEGEILQVPPMYSAIKVKGKKLYELARKGIEVERESRKIRIDKLELIEYSLPEIKIYVECSKGTYVRQLAEDIGEKLGSVACISQIERTKVGPCILENAVSLNDLSENNLKSWENFSGSNVT